MSVQAFAPAGKPAYRIKSNPTTGQIEIPGLPSGQAAIGASGVALSYGPWQEIVSSLAYDALIVGASYDLATLSVYGALQIGLGPAGSESGRAILPFSQRYGGSYYTNNGYPIPLPVPIFVPSGTRVAGRFYYSTTSATNFMVDLMVVRVSDLEGF